MLRIALGIALVAGFGQAASATTWKMIEPEDYAERCPVIVRGTIVSVEKRQPGRDRVDVVIRIEQIFKNALSDSPLKVGGDLTTRRNVGNRLSGSEDMDYPEKTRALWLVEMDEKGEFRIDRHPSQKQSAKLVLDLGATAFQRAPDADFARGPIARKEWIEERRIADTWQSEEQRKAKTLELFALAGELAEASTVDEKSMRRISALPKDRRRDFLRYSTYEQPLKGERLGAVLAHMLARDTDDEIRAFAAIYLAGRDLPRDGSVKVALLGALADPSPRVRYSACVGLSTRKEKGCTVAIAARLKDADRDVRLVAVRVLGRFREVRALPAILALYDREKADDLREFAFAESLANLGETKVSLTAARRALDSDNGRLRDSIVDSLRQIDSEAILPVAMEWLASEMRRTIDRVPGSGFDRGSYASLCFILTRGGQKYQTDPTVWFEWWEKARVDYAAPPLKIDAGAVRKVYAEYKKAR